MLSEVIYVKRLLGNMIAIVLRCVMVINFELAVAELKAGVPGRIIMGRCSCPSARNPQVSRCPCLARAPENLR